MMTRATVNESALITLTSVGENSGESEGSRAGKSFSVRKVDSEEAPSVACSNVIEADRAIVSAAIC